MNARPVTTDDLEALERATTQALAIVIGLLAEAVGSQKLTYHFAGALQAAAQAQPNGQRDRLLEDAYRLVVLKAQRAAPDDPVIQELHANLTTKTTKH